MNTRDYCWNLVNRTNLCTNKERISTCWPGAQHGSPFLPKKPKLWGMKIVHSQPGYTLWGIGYISTAPFNGGGFRELHDDQRLWFIHERGSWMPFWGDQNKFHALVMLQIKKRFLDIYIANRAIIFYQWTNYRLPKELINYILSFMSRPSQTSSISIL